MAIEVLTSGYVSMDHILKIQSPARVGFTSLIGNESCTTNYPGGCSVNIAYALSRLGVSAAPVLRVGRDWEEVGLKAFLEDGHVPLDAVSVVPDDITSVSYLIEDNEGQHITLYYPGSMDGRRARPLPDELFQGVRYGVITVASLADNQEFYKKCRLFGVPIIFGMKGDATAFPHDFLKELLLHSQVIFTNESERASIEHEFGLDSLTDLLGTSEATTIVTTYGARGSAFWACDANGEMLHECVPCCACTTVVDTTGGGDAYMSGFIYGLLSGRGLGECCRMGATMASFILEHEGCCTGAPTTDEFIRRFEAFNASEVK